MTPSWEVVRRAQDDERVGYLAPVAGSDGLVVPMTLAGTPAAAPMDGDEASTLLAGTGLALLARRWWCRLPAVLPPGVTDAGRPAADWDWRAVLLVEVGPHRVRVRPELPEPAEGTASAVLPVPAGDLLS